MYMDTFCLIQKQLGQVKFTPHITLHYTTLHYTTVLRTVIKELADDISLRVGFLQTATAQGISP